MCPDNEILSLYFDKELPSPWKEKMDAHLVSCGKCQIRLGKYRALRAVLEQDRAGIPIELEERVWAKVSGGIPREAASRGGREFSPVKTTYPTGLWNRRVSLPLPAAAAAIAFIAFTALWGIQSLGAPGADRTGIVADIGTDVQGIVPVSGINDVLQYLSREDMADFTTIRLPETRNFFSSGEPALLKAADYSRRNSSR